MSKLSSAVGVLALAALCSTATGSPINSALRYDGGDFSAVPHNSTFSQIEATDRVTIEAWINVAGYPQGWFPIVDKYRTATDFGWTFQIFGGPGFPSSMQFVGGIGPTASVPFTPTLNQWTHVAMAYDRSQGSISFYANGQLLGTQAYTADIQGTGTNTPLYIGFGPSGGDEFAQGVIDELRIWNRRLTSAEILANYNRSLFGNEPGLVGYWRFDEGSGTTFKDSTANGNTGTLGSGTFTPTWLNQGAPITPIPEPTTLVSVGLCGAAGVLTAAWRRRRMPAPPVAA